MSLRRGYYSSTMRATPTAVSPDVHNSHTGKQEVYVWCFSDLQLGRNTS